MMGRSHAMLGAIAYAGLSYTAPLTHEQIGSLRSSLRCTAGDTSCSVLQGGIKFLTYPLYADRSIVVTIWVVALALTFLYPRIMWRAHKDVDRAIPYRVLQAVVVSLGAALLGQLLYQRAPYLFPRTPFDRLIWIFAVAGFALIPDLDEPGSTISRLFGPISRGFSALMRQVAGGHRRGTHSWIGVLAGLVIALASQRLTLWFGIVLMGFMLMTSFVLASRMILPDRLRIAPAALMVLAGLVAWYAAIGKIDPRPMLLALPLGILLHDLGDWVTNSGIPFLYPLPRKYAAKVFSTGQGFESFVVQPVFFAAVSAVLVFWVGIPLVRWIGMNDLSGLSSLPSLATVVARG